MQMLTTEQVRTVQAEIDRQRIMAALVRVAVGNDKTREDYACMAARARYEYTPTHEHGRVYNAIWGVIGYLVLAVEGWAEYFSEWNRR